MKLARFSHGGDARLGLVVAGDGIVDLTRRLDGKPSDMIALIAGWPRLRGAVADLQTGPADHALSTVKLLAPVARPPKIFAIGLNYADHCAESGLEIPKQQTWFSKAATAVNGPFDPIELPAVSEQLDYECEMVAVIGKRCRNVPRDRAKEAVFGYCVGDDVSV
ncbi:MAG TPA: fumarylacetoacetate hydrolase family protein, partial [Rhizomicrobium sp.]